MDSGGCFVNALMRWKPKSICQVTFDQLITDGLVRRRNGLRWLTRQLKPLCRDFWELVPVLLFWSTGLLKSSIMRNFIFFYNFGCTLLCKPQKWSESGQTGPIGSLVYQQQLLSFVDLAGRGWLVVLKNGGVLFRTLPTAGKVKHSSPFPPPRTAIKAHSDPDSMPVLNVSNISFLNSLWKQFGLLTCVSTRSCSLSFRIDESTNKLSRLSRNTSL